MRRAARALVRWLGYLALLAVLALCALLPKRRAELLFGTTPLISNSHWARALRAAGLPAKTLMAGYYSINRREDFDLYYEDFIPGFLASMPRLAGPVSLWRALLYTFRNARAVHISFHGWILGPTPLWRLEGWLLRACGIKVIAIPYGADAYRFSSLPDTSLRHGLLMSYPQLALAEEGIDRRVRYWSRHADCVICGHMMEGMPRWDVLTPCPFAIDLQRWTAQGEHSSHDGRSGPVRVVHAPNHRGFKGSEFLLAAVETLRAEGLQVELTLLERSPNEEVRRALAGADILADQFVAAGYAFNALEGMASALPVLCNLESEFHTRVFRRYSFLGECPIVSAAPETLVERLRALVVQPQRRRELGLAGRAYVEKYHSYAAAQHLFGAIYRKLFDGEDVDLINLFHPLKARAGRAC